MRNKIIILVTVIVLSICISIYLNLENTTLEVSNYTISNKRIPLEFNGYKIIHISDYHNEKSQRLNNSLVETIASQNPDIIVITGDVVDKRRTDIDVSIEFVKKIKDIAPIYYVPGNHEATIKTYNELKEKLLNEGVNILDNKNQEIEKNGDKINLLGINDPQMANASEINDSVIAKKTLEEIEYNDEYYSILLSHRPEIFSTYVEEKVDLVFTGHAHGGQVRIPFIGGIVAPNQGFFPKYTSGKIEENDTTMVVSRGIGNSVIPFRVNNRPEIIIVTLQTN